MAGPRPAACWRLLGFPRCFMRVSSRLGLGELLSIRHGGRSRASGIDTARVTRRSGAGPGGARRLLRERGSAILGRVGPSQSCIDRFPAAANGFRGMPPWRHELSEQELRAVVAYVLGKEFSNSGVGVKNGTGDVLPGE